MNLPPKLSISIALALLIAAVAFTITNYFLVLDFNVRHRTAQATSVAMRQASRLAGLAAKAQRVETDERLKSELGLLNEDTDVKYAVICDNKDHVLQSSIAEWNGRRIGSTDASDSDKLTYLVRKSQDSQTMLLPAKDVVIVAVPIIPANSKELPGAALIEKDLSSSNNIARETAWKSAAISAACVLGSSVILWSALHFLITARAARAMESVRGAASLNGSPAAILGGADELAQITRSAQEARELLQSLARGIQEHEQRYRGMVETLSVMVFVSRNDRIEFMNRAGLKMLGAGSSAEVLGKSPFDIIHPDYHAAERERIRAVTGSAAELPVIEEKIVRLDGTTLDVDSVSSLFRDERGPAIQFVMSDISERTQGRANLDALSRDLQEKNRELETIVYVASHDLRSPLLNVMGFSRHLGAACQEMETLLLQNMDASAEKARLEALLKNTVPRSLRFIEQGVSKMDALLTGFLRFSRVGRHEMELQELNMDAMLKSIAETMTYQIQQAGAEIRIDALPRCRGDAMQTSQVFTNLLDNALKYRKPGHPCVISVQGTVDEGRAIYTVADNGIGIDREHQGKIFEIFHRLHPDSLPGEGLGLTIARRIVQRMGGTISLTSQPGNGSTFTIDLPAA